MQIKIPIPVFLARAYDRFAGWANIPIFKGWRGEIRYIDLALFAGFLFSAVYYYFQSGTQSALAGAVIYLIVMATALMMRG